MSYIFPNCPKLNLININTKTKNKKITIGSKTANYKNKVEMYLQDTSKGILWGNKQYYKLKWITMLELSQKAKKR